MGSAEKKSFFVVTKQGKGRGSEPRLTDFDKMQIKHPY